MSVSVIRSSSSQQDIIINNNNNNPLKEKERQGDLKRTESCVGREPYDDAGRPEKIIDNNVNNNSTGNCCTITRTSSSPVQSSTSPHSGSRRKVSLTLQLNKKDDQKVLMEKLNMKNQGNFLSPNGSYCWKTTPNVQVMSIAVKCTGRSEVEIPEPFISTPKAILFSLKEASKYRFKFSFIVSNKDVVGLKYINTIWKAGVRVDKTEALLGTYKPREEPYEYELDEDTTPSGIFVRGLYCAKIKVVDYQGNCYMDIKYYFELQKN